MVTKKQAIARKIAGLLTAALFILVLCSIDGGGNSPSNPDVKTYTGNLTDRWGSINVEIQSAQRYVILDLSTASFTGDTITGRSNHSGNALNIIKDNQYIKGIILPNSLKTIGRFAFYEYGGLVSVTIPAGVTSIEGWAFGFCSGLKSVKEFVL